MKKELFKFSNRLGFMNPFYIKKDNNSLMKEKKTPISIIQILNKSYTFGDRTFIKDVNLTPWMAKPNEESNDWEFEQDHGSIVVSEEDAAKSLFKKLKKEIKVLMLVYYCLVGWIVELLHQ